MVDLLATRSSGGALEVPAAAGIGDVAALPAGPAGHILETAGLALMRVTTAYTELGGPGA